MSNMSKDTTNNKWVLNYDIAGSGNKKITFPTRNMFVDENIEVNLSTPAGALDAGTGSVSGSSTATGLLGAGTSTQPASGYYVKVEGAANVGVATAGWLTVGEDIDVSIADVYYPVNAATFAFDGADAKSVNAGYVGAGETLLTMSNGSQTITGGGLSTTASSSELASNGLSNGSTVDSTKKIALSTSDADGYYELEASGSATVARAAVTKQVTSAGYFAADNSAVTAIEAGTESVSNTHAKYYVAQSTLSASSVTPSTSAQTVTIGPGYYHEARTVTVAAMDPGAASSSFDNSGLSTYFNAGTSSSYDVSVTPQHSITTAGYLAATANPVDGTPSYYSIKTTSVTEGTTTVSGTTVTRGIASWGTGWITSGSISAASFANEGTSGKTYVDISDTSAAPVLVSGDYLYINAGYTDDLKISLSKLVPDGTDVKGHAEYILSGHTALDEDGTVVTGSIQTYDGSYTIE